MIKSMRSNETVYVTRFDSAGMTEVPVTEPHVTLNGATRDSLMDQQKAVLDALSVLRKALLEAFPHGRDFQTDPSRLQAARDEVNSELHALDIIGVRHSEIMRRLWEN